MQADRVTDFLRDHAEHGGLFAFTFSLVDGAPQGNQLGIGARADSAYEYLLKLWVMTGRTEPKFLDLCTSLPSLPLPAFPDFHARVLPMRQTSNPRRRSSST